MSDCKKKKHPGGRPTKYKPEFCEYNGRAVVYGLCDSNGKIFYVGRTKNLQSRMNAYCKGKFHGNKGLERMVLQHGVNPSILEVDIEDLSNAEMRHIQSRSDLVNIVVDDTPFFQRSKKPWVVSGVACPTRLYAMHMRNAFGDSVDWLYRRLKKCTDEERLAIECNFADFLVQYKPDVICKWLNGLNVEVEA